MPKFIQQFVLIFLVNKSLSKKNIIIIKVSSNKKRVLRKIADKLIKNRLVACVNFLNNVDSFYLWNEKVIKNKEYIMLIKTILEKEKIVYKEVKSMHNYEVPEIMTIKVSEIDNDYRKWLIGCVNND